MSIPVSFAPQVLLLDPVGDAPVPPGYTVADTDVAWLRATANVLDGVAPKVVVRGEQRCQWAYVWWQARGGKVFTCISPATQLRDRCPALTETQARQVLADLPTPITAQLPTLAALLADLYPSFAYWQALPPHPASSALRLQAAQWLIWLAEQPAPFLPHHLPVVQALLASWKLSHPASAPFFPVSPTEARSTLNTWLGYANPASHSVTTAAALSWAEAFPLAATPWLATANQAFALQITTALSAASAGKLDEAALAWWQQQVAQFQRPEIRLAALSALIQQLQVGAFASAATERLVSVLERSPAATPLHVAVLRRLVPPPVPSAPPTNPAAALQWTIQQYLPFRRWQASQINNSNAASQARQLAQQFSDWFLASYRDQLIGTIAPHQQQYWSQRAIQTPASNELVLWIIADGLGWSDALSLQQQIVERAAGRLSLATATPCFGLVPTITSFTKRSVRWAVPLRYVAQAQASYFAQHPTPPADVRGIDNLAQAVLHAQPGQLLVWQPPQPDSVYHESGNAQTVRNNAAGALTGLAINISEAIAAIPSSLAVRVLITTDHGRLLSESPRTLSPLTGFTGHGRAAFRAKPPTTMPIPRPEGAEDTDAIRWLDPERYRLPDWVAISRSEDSFKIVQHTGSMRGGTDLFPHGGAWPEEVVVPWIELHSHLVPLVVSGTFTGEARSNRAGKAVLRLVNSSSRPARLRQLLIAIPRVEPLSFEFNELLPGESDLSYNIDLPRWPDTAQAEKTKVTVHLETPDGEQHPFVLTVDLRNTDLRQVSANPLDDLLL
jgi:hypothetical protein